MPVQKIDSKLSKILKTFEIEKYARFQKKKKLKFGDELILVLFQLLLI